ncbi:MAG: hypothetical protein QOG15_2137 [Solirubrobacteraceae bacterium]|jgi:hypothetical protein|nr:hypothetical protein [Solirubrobacteraceae bacterium]
MRHRQPILVVVAAAALLTIAGVLLVIGGSSAAPSKSQALFRTTLLADEKTTPEVKSLLRDGGGFVAPEIQFTDVTGDGRSDAVVLVETGGVAGAVALYVFSTHGKAANSDLRAVYRSQRLYRTTVQTTGQDLAVRVPLFKRGDDVCCPNKLVERIYSWSDAAKTLVKRSSREIAGPS